MTIVIICETCGNENEADADFCWFDGEPLEWSGKRVDKETGQPVGDVAAPDDSVYDVGPLYQSEAAPAPAPEPVVSAPPPPAPVEAAPPPEPPAPAAPPPPAPEPVPEPVAFEPPAPAPEPVPEPVAVAEPETVVAPPAEEEHENAAEQLLKKFPGRRRKEAAQPAAAAAAPPAPPAPAPPPAPVRAAAPPPPAPAAPPSAPPSRIVPPPPTPAAPPTAPTGANGGTSAAAPPPVAPAAPAPKAPEAAAAAPVKLTRDEEEKARKKAEEEEAARLAAEEEERRKEAAKRLYIPVKTEPEPAPPPPPAPVAAPEPVKLTWWQRFVAWLKRVWTAFKGLFVRKPKAAAPAPTQAQAPAAPAAAAAPPAAAATAVTQATATAPTPTPTAQPPSAQTPSAEIPTARPPGKEKQAGPKVPTALKPTKEFERKPRTERKVEEVPQYEPGDLICTQCGTGNRPTNKFCKRCGSSLAEATIAQKPPWWKRMLTKLHLRKRKQFEAGYRKRTKEGGSKKFFWRLQSLSFRSVGIVFLAVAAVGLYAGWGPTLKHRGTVYYNYFHDLFLPSFKNVSIVSATASSHLNNSTRPKNVFDGHFNTPWVSKSTPTHGALQTITIHLDSAVRFGLVGFRSGAQTKKGDLIQSVTRPAKVRIFFFDAKGRRLKGKSELCTLDDTPNFQKCPAVDLPNVKTIKVRVLAVHGKTGRRQPVGIGEIEARRRT